MKKYWILSLMLCCAFGWASAQQYQHALGLHIGYDRSIYRVNSPLAETSTELTATPMNGLKLGLDLEETFWKGMGVNMGLNYTFAGKYSNWTKVGAYDYPKTRTFRNMHQLEIFVDWQYKFEIAKNTYLILYTGPTIQCGLSYKGNIETQLTQNNVSKNRADYFDYESKDESDRQRLNITWGVGAGFQYERYYIRGGYDFGIFNPYKVQNFNEIYPLVDRYTRGRLDQWSIRAGIYLWQR